MNALTITKHQDQFVVDSREVAEMVGKRHDHLLRDISGYIDILITSTDPKIGASDFFIPNDYQDSTGRKLPCFLLTRKGCDMVANKMTGEKGVLFTAAYVTKFEEMERQISTAPAQIDSKFLFQIAAQLEEKERQIQLLTPAAEFGNTVGNSAGSILIRDFAKVLANDGIKIGQDRLFSWLNVNRYIYRQNGQWMAYKDYVDMGLFKVTEKAISSPTSGDFIGYTIRVTGKGQKYFYEKLKKGA